MTPTTPTMMSTTPTTRMLPMTPMTQRQKVLKASIALALYRSSGQVPKEAEIDHFYQLTYVLYHAVFSTDYSDTHHQKRRQPRGQLVLF